MRLVAVVLSYNGRDDTLAALESLRGIETVVVDNGSADGSAAAVAERFPEVELVRAGVNLGFAGGNNVGIRRALDRGAEWVLLVNNDALVEPGLVEALSAAAAARPDAGVLACKVLFADSDRLWYAGAGFDPILGRSRHEGFGEPDAPGALADTRRATGAAMAVSRAAIEAAGLLDEELFLYAEDLEWSLRIAEAGFAVVYVPEARVRHRVSAASGRRRLADDELLRDAQHARRGRALPAASARPHGAPPRARRRTAGSCSRRDGRPRPRRHCGAGGTTAAAGWAAASLSAVANERSSFYRRVLEQLLEEGVIRRDMSVLVVAGGPADRDAFRELGFGQVTISNVDEKVAAEELAPYEWSFQDAEALTLSGRKLRPDRRLGGAPPLPLARTAPCSSSTVSRVSPRSRSRAGTAR